MGESEREINVRESEMGEMSVREWEREIEWERKVRV